MRRYKYLNNEKAHKNDVAYEAKNIAEKYIFQRSSLDIYYIVCDTVEEFYAHYLTKDPSSRMYNEVINDKFSPQKLKIDIDGRIGDDEMTYLLKIIRKLFRYLTTIIPEMLVYDISTSHHIIVANFCFTAACCEMLASVICEKVSKRYPTVASLIDIGVYKKVQMFRIEGSTKYGQRRWKYFAGTKKLSSLEIFKKGIISHVDDCHYIDADKVVDTALDIGVFKYAERESEKMQSMNKSIPKEFIVRKIVDNLTVLDRIAPSYCDLCSRVHDNDGAYMVGKKFFCRRARS